MLSLIFECFSEFMLLNIMASKYILCEMYIMGVVLMVQKAVAPHKCLAAAIKVAVKFDSQVHGVDVGA
jgi:hypothetical protein